MNKHIARFERKKKKDGASTEATQFRSVRAMMSQYFHDLPPFQQERFTAPSIDAFSRPSWVMKAAILHNTQRVCAVDFMVFHAGPIPFHSLRTPASTSSQDAQPVVTKLSSKCLFHEHGLGLRVETLYP